MRVAVLARGPIRPSPAQIIHNLKVVGEVFAGLDRTIFLQSYAGDDAQIVRSAGVADQYILLPEPAAQDVKKVFWMTNACQRQHPEWWPVENTYKHFWSHCEGVRHIMAAGAYDFIFYIRSDMEFIGPNPRPLTEQDDMWVRGKYVIPDFYHCPVMNDTCGVAEPAVMLKAWDYQTPERLNQLNGAAFNAESVLDRIRREAGIELVHSHQIPRYLARKN